MASDVKPFWQSKTFWANVVMGAAAFVPKVQEHLTPEKMAIGFSVANMLLRFVSKGKITIS